MCFRTEDLLLNPIPQLGHFAAGIKRVWGEQTSRKFLTVLFLFHIPPTVFTMQTTSESYESLIPFIEHMNELLPVSI